MSETSPIIRRYLHPSVTARFAGPRSGSVTRTAPLTMRPERARCRASARQAAHSESSKRERATDRSRRPLCRERKRADCLVVMGVRTDALIRPGYS